MSFGRTLLLEILGLLLVCLTVTAAYIRPSTRLWAKGSGGFGTSPATKKGEHCLGSCGLWRTEMMPRTYTTSLASKLG